MDRGLLRVVRTLLVLATYWAVTTYAFWLFVQWWDSRNNRGGFA